MIVKIDKNNFIGTTQIINNQPDNYDFLPVYTDGTYYYCYTNDTTPIVVNYEIVAEPGFGDTPTNLTRLVDIQLLDLFNLPHGN
jgi:hypothetical protein